MIKLTEIKIKQFKEVIYPEYLKLFPKDERKTYEVLEKLFSKGIAKIIEIMDNNLLIGFMIINTLKDNRYIQLDYFAIFPQYQKQGYGTQALNLFKEQSKEYDGIFIEVEKFELGNANVENKLRERRIKFYERAGFYKLDFDLEWFKSLILSPYILQTSNYKDNKEEILRSMFEIYTATHGKEKVENSCKVINMKV